MTNERAIRAIAGTIVAVEEEIQRIKNEKIFFRLAKKKKIAFCFKELRPTNASEYFSDR